MQKFVDAWDRYSKGLDGDKINVKWDLRWTKIHGDCKSSARAVLRSYAMRTTNNEYKVKLEYNGDSVFDHPVTRAPITAAENDAKSQVKELANADKNDKDMQRLLLEAREIIRREEGQRLLVDNRNVVDTIRNCMKVYSHFCLI